MSSLLPALLCKLFSVCESIEYILSDYFCIAGISSSLASAHSTLIFAFDFLIFWRGDNEFYRHNLSHKYTLQIVFCLKLFTGSNFGKGKE